MNILISSLVDLKNSAHNSRLHQFVRNLSNKNEITIISINDHWKKQWDKKYTEYREDFSDLFDKIEISYLTDKDISPVIQDIFAFKKRDIMDIINSHNFDVHFCYNGLFSGYKIAKLSKSNNIPTVYDIADDLPEMINTSPQIPRILRPIGKVFGKKVMNNLVDISDKVTLTTQSIADTYSIPQNKVVIIPNGVDINLFREYPSWDMKMKLGLSGNFIVGYVGVLREWIELEPLMAAIEQLSKKISIKLLIVGSGADYQKTVSIAAKYDIAKNVLFTGTIPYSLVPKYISCMDVGTIPFKGNDVAQNSLPLKLFEYMACNKPVISTDILAIHQQFPENVLFASSISDYVAQITRLVDNEDLRKELGLAGRRIVEDNYQWSRITSQLEKGLQSAGGYS